MLHNLDADSSKIVNVLNQDPNGVRLTQAQVLYVEYLVSNMKAIGTWQLSNAVYGFVGGTDYKHKFNWKDPRDVDAAFRLSFIGAVNHSSLGIQSSTGGYANTFLNPFTHLTSKNNVTIATYLTAFVTPNQFVEMGALAASNNRLVIRGGFDNGSNKTAASSIGSDLSNAFSANDFIKKGFLLGTRTSENSHKIFIDGVLSGVDSLNNASGGLPNLNLFLLGYNANGNITAPSKNTHGFDLILNSGFTDTQATQQSQIVTNAQNILSRA